jgi:hypothetical protein
MATKQPGQRSRAADSCPIASRRGHHNRRTDHSLLQWICVQSHTNSPGTSQSFQTDLQYHELFSFFLYRRSVTGNVLKENAVGFAVFEKVLTLGLFVRMGFRSLEFFD